MEPEATARQRAAAYAVWRAEALAHGGAAEERDGLLCWSTGVAVTYWNGAYVTRLPAQPVQIEWARRWFAEREKPYGVLVPVELEPAVAAAAGTAGLRLTAVQRCMALHARDYVPPAPSPSGFEIRPTTSADLADFLTVQVEAFRLEPVPAREFLAPPVGMPAWTHLTGYLDGRPVTSGIAVRTGDAVGVYGVGTTVAARRQGLGAALTAALLTAAFDAGATFAHLNPSDLAAGVYRRLGFREAGGFAIWLR